MIYILQQQYNLIRSSREAVLNFIETEVGEDINSPVQVFENHTIRYLLVHTANVYLIWLHNFPMDNVIEFFNDEDFKTIGALRSLYADTDKRTEVFLTHFTNRLNEPINGTLSHNRKFTSTPLEVFTHAITHEFHHKGQIMTMCRLLGYVPPDSDIIRF